MSTSLSLAPAPRFLLSHAHGGFEAAQAELGHWDRQQLLPGAGTSAISHPTGAQSHKVQQWEGCETGVRSGGCCAAPLAFLCLAVPKDWGLEHPGVVEGPCPWQGWNGMGCKVPSNPHRAVILGFPGDKALEWFGVTSQGRVCA